MQRNTVIVDRYGAMPMQSEFLINDTNFEKVKMNIDKPLLVELYNDKSTHCLLKSMPIREILPRFDSKAVYRKVKVTNKDILNKYNIHTLPALLFFKNGILVKKIEGYFNSTNVDNVSFANTAKR